jgi:hypothetical protein
MGTRLTLVDRDKQAQEGATPGDAPHGPREHPQRIALHVLAPKHKHRDEMQRRVHRQHEFLLVSAGISPKGH